MTVRVCVRVCCVHACVGGRRCWSDLAKLSVRTVRRSADCGGVGKRSERTSEGIGEE